MDGTEIVGTDTAFRVDEGASLTLVNVNIHQAPQGEESRYPWPAAITLDDGAEAAIDGATIAWLRQGVSAKGTALVVVHDGRIAVSSKPGEKQSTAAIFLKGGAVAAVAGGELGGPDFAVIATDTSTVSLEGVKTVGRVRTDSNATATATKAEPASGAETSFAELVAGARKLRDGRKAEYERLRAYSQGACDGVIECFADEGYVGPINGTVTLPFDAKGKPGALQVTGATPPAVAKCLRTMAKDRTIPGFEGPAGKLVCNFSGTLMKGAQMTQTDGDYLKTR
jgi:hypothetical protein